MEGDASDRLGSVTNLVDTCAKGAERAERGVLESCRERGLGKGRRWWGGAKCGGDLVLWGALSVFWGGALSVEQFKGR